MVTVENIRKISASGNGIHTAVLDLIVSTSAELPELGAVVGGMAVDAASIAFVIQENKWCTLDANGTWYTSGAEG